MRIFTALEYSPHLTTRLRTTLGTAKGITPRADVEGSHEAITGAPAKFGPEIAAFRPSQLRERTSERYQPRLRDPIALRIAHQHTDPPHPIRLLRERQAATPLRCRAA
ncbi:MAG TPA: hypothetical protein VH678_31435 [Xanthobacteraceae bacterium]|jgi:hypothetical protein